MKNLTNKKQILSWAFYDFGNSAFATTVIAGFFPIFFKKYWSAGTPATESTFYLGIANSTGSLLLFLLAPFLGALADLTQSKKNFLTFFTLVGLIFTAGLYWIGQGQWQLAMLFYAVAGFGFSSSQIFYDSLIVNITEEKNYDRVSGIGYSLGYLGGGILFVINAVMTMKPHWFGLSDATEAVKWSFLSVTAWWGLFALPLLFNVKEKRNHISIKFKQVKNAYKLVFNTFREIKKYKVLFWFLAAYIFYIDGVNTLIKMAVDYGLSIGLQDTSLLTALIIVQFVAFPAAYFFGIFGERKGALSGIKVCILGYIAITIGGYFMTNETHFYILAASIGCFQGGIQLLSRSYFASLIPKDKSAEFFGFYNMVGKFSAVLGPVLVGLTSFLTESARASILVIVIFFVIGGTFLTIHEKRDRSINGK